MDLLNLSLVYLTALVLFGSPGPAIAALVAVGKKNGFRAGLNFYFGLQVGLATACAISAAGLFTLLQAVPGATTAMAVVAASYLLYLAYKIAFQPVGDVAKQKLSAFNPTPFGGFIIGFTNPKSYISFVSIMSSHIIVGQNLTLDAVVKWAICVSTMMFVDLIWLRLGDVIRKSNLSIKSERLLNRVMGGTILVTVLLAFL